MVSGFFQNKELQVQDIDHLHHQIAEVYGVTPEIHPDDFIYQFVINNPVFPAKKDAVNYYFSDGAKSAKILSDLIFSDLKIPKQENKSLLEFASGYGCVSRHLSRQLPRIKITSCDIHQAAVDFIMNKIKLPAIISHVVPENFTPGKNYDIVFALSFFSHMPRTTWGRWIKALFNQLNAGGYLIFTTHGRKSIPFLGNPTIPEDGFWFRPDSEQKDLKTTEYGLTVTTPEFVLSELFDQIDAPVVKYRYGFWWGHQDLYVVKKNQDRS